MIRPATLNDLPHIWDIIQYAISKRKEDGSNQWQDGYPNLQGITKDINQNSGYVLTSGEEIAGYFAVFVNDEPAYEAIEGKWLSEGDFIAVHRIAIAEKFIGKKLPQEIMLWIESFAINNNIYSIKADTNFDNQPMLHIFKKFGYVHCGEVYFRGSSRKAFEKLLK